VGKYTDLSDIEVLKKVTKYDSRALEELYLRYSPLLFTMVKKIVGDQETASDVISDIFAIIWRKSDKFILASGNVYGWIVLLARNKSVDFVHRKMDEEYNKEPYNDEYEDYFILPQLGRKIDSLDLETAMNIKGDIESALEKLTDAQKYVIHLGFYDGLTLDKIAEKLKIPVETVRSKLMTALHNLRDNLLQGS